MSDKPFQFNATDGGLIGVIATDETITIVVPGVLEMTIDHESAAALARAIYAKATRMPLAQAREFLAGLIDDEWPR